METQSKELRRLADEIRQKTQSMKQKVKSGSEASLIALQKLSGFKEVAIAIYEALEYFGTTVPDDLQKIAYRLEKGRYP